MSNQSKSRKGLHFGILAAVVALTMVLCLVMAGCNNEQAEAGTTVPATTVADEGAERIDLYWNIDRALYDGKSEAGMSSREPAEDGMFHVRFFKDGEIIELRVADRKVINAMEVQSLMGLEFNEDGIVVGVIHVDDMPVEKLAWQFYVKSVGGKLIKANSSVTFNGMEIMLETDDNTGIWDMTGMSGDAGCDAELMSLDRIMAVGNEDGRVTHVFIYDRPNYMKTHEGECQHCQKTVTWYEWTKANEMPVSTGHYQLMNNIQLKAQPNQQEDSKICLDLNGKRVDGATNLRCYAMFNPGAELAVMDTSEGQTGVMAAHGRGDQGMVIWVRYGQLHLYGGTLDASDANTKLWGPSIHIDRNAFFYMYDGTIIGGTAEAWVTDKGAWQGGLGGNVTLNGKMVMNGGVLRDGHAKSKITWKNGKATYNRGFGGNLYIADGAVVEINGGLITEGVADKMGGNIYMADKCELIINDCIVYGGSIVAPGQNGGNLWAGVNAKITQRGGSILAGESYNCGGNVYFNGEYIMTDGVIADGIIRDVTTREVVENSPSANIFNVCGKFKMYGGFVNGGVQAIDTSATDKLDTTVLVSGYAKIDGGEHSNRNLTLSPGGSGITMYVGNMLEGAKVGVYATTGYFTLPTKEYNKEYFFSDVEGVDVVYHDGRLAMGRLQCICGSNSDNVEDHLGKCKENGGEKVLFGAWPSNNSMPTTGGNYFLTQDVTLATTANLITAGNGKNVVVNMDLNGKQVTAGGTAGTRMFSLFEGTSDIAGEGVHLSLSDSVGTAKVTMTKRPASGDQGLLVWGRYPDSVIDIYGGSYDGTAIYSDKQSGVIITTAGELNMYGGTITGGTSTTGGIVAIAATGTFNMYDGVIENGKATRMGGNVLVVAPAVMNMYGGIIRGGSINADGTLTGDIGYGGNVYAQGTLNMYGGEITGGLVKRTSAGGGLGGNLAVAGTVNLLGGKITNGNADVGGNLATNSANAAIVFDGVQVLNGQATNGGNIAINVRGNKGVTIKGDTLISGGKAVTNGGNLYSNPFLTVDAGTVINIIGGVIENGSAKDGGNLYLLNNTQANVSNSVIRNGTAATNGGNVVAASGGKLNMTNTDLIGGTAAQAGSLYAGSNAVITLKDLDITGGKSTVYSGNVYVGTSGSLTIENVKISGGTNTGTIGGGNIYVDNIFVATNSIIENGSATKGNAGNIGIGTKGKVTLTDVTISGGKAVNGANIYVNGGTLTTTGGAVKNGAASDKGANLTAASGGKATMTGTNFVGGSSNVSGNIYAGSNAVITLKNLSVTGGTSKAHAGSVYVAGSANLTVDNVVLDGGKSNSPTYGGGNVFVEGGTFTATNSTIKNGSALNGANLYGYGASKLTLTNTTITGGNATGAGGGIHLTNTASLVINGGSIVNNGKQNISAAGTNTLQISGGTIGGGVDCNAGTTLKLSGAPIIDKAQSTTNAPAYGLNLGGKAISDVSGMTGGKVYIYGIEGLFTGAVSTAHGDYFFSDIEDKEVVFTMAGLAIGEVSTSSEYCICGNKAIGKKDHTCQVAEWTAWKKTDSLPTAAGNYYLTGDVTLNAQTTISANVAIDLHGFDITYQVPLSTNDVHMLVAQNGGKLFITDSTAVAGTLKLVIPDYSGASEAIQAKMKAGNSGMLLWACADSAITVFDGCFNGASIVATVDSPVICVDANGTFTMYGGTVIGGKAPNGGSVGVSGAFNMYGGTVQNGVATAQGGNLYVKAGAVATISNATFANGQATDGGNIFSGGTVTITDSTVSGGKASNGGNIYSKESTAKLTAIGCTFENSNATGNGGNITLVRAGDTSFTNCSISSSVKANMGGNIYVKTCKLTMTDCQLSNGYATHGGNIYLDGGTLTTTGGAFKSGIASDKGANLTVAGGGKATMTGTNFVGGSSNVSGNIYAGTNAVIVLKDLSITGGTSKAHAGSINVGGTANVSLENVVMDGGKSNSPTYGGGNVFVEGGTFTATNSTIKNGSALNGANLYGYGASKLTLTNTTVTGGNATGAGGGIYLTNTASLTINGGSIVNNGKQNISAAGTNTLQISGGTIGGGVDCNAGTTLKLSGAPIIDKAQSTTNAPAYGLNLAGKAIADVSGMTGGKVHIYGIDELFTAPVDRAFKNYFASDVEGKNVVFTTEGLFLGDPSHYDEPAQTEYCVCGGKAKGMKNHTCENVTWTAWTETDKLPTTAGNYYLTGNVNLTEQTVVSGQKVNIDLLGNKINFTVPIRQDGYRLLRAENGAAVSITDSTDNPGTVTVIIPDYSTASDEIKAKMKTGNSGMLFWVWANSSVTVYDGVYDATQINVTKIAPTVEVLSGGTFNVYGGTIKPGQLTGNGSDNIGIAGTMNMYGGTITGGRGKQGGNVGVYGLMNLYGGTIEKGYATEKGGNINIQPSKTLNMSGGTVTGGFAGSHSGNIYINDNGLCSITGGLVTKGTTNGQGGNMAVTGKLHITGGEVSDGLADVDLSNAGHGGNIWISGANAEFIVKNAKILNGGRLNYEVYGGNIFVNNNGAKVFEIGEGAVISGGKAHRGGNIYIGHLTRNFNTYKITGGTITGGSASYLGTNIVLFGTSEANMPVLTISGGEIKEAGNGINVALGASTSNCYAKVIMTGGSVTGGRLVVYPGGVFDATAGGTLSYNTLTLGSSQTTHGQILLPTP